MQTVASYEKTHMPKIIIVENFVLLCVFGLCVMSSATAAPITGCSSDMASRVESFLLRADVSWQQLSQHQKTEPYCDDGYFAEGYSDLVVRLFANGWNDFDAFITVARSRPDFYRWAISHIDETTSPKDLKKVIFNASSCRTDQRLGRFCQDVFGAAEQALARTRPRK